MTQLLEKTNMLPKRPNFSLYLQVMVYAAAGINHFVHPDFYLRIIPPYLPDHSLLNALSGISELLLAVLLLFPFTRNIAVYGLIALLIAFIPAHIYLIQISQCSTPGFCLPLAIAWIRLLPGQFLLIWWAWKLREHKKGFVETPC
ncbi:MAG: DoxX family protein [Chitinophagaceae bacterium]